MRQLNFHVTPPHGCSLALWSDGTWYLFYPESSIDEVEKFLEAQLERFRRESVVIKKALARKAEPEGCKHPAAERVMNNDTGELTCLACKTVLFKLETDDIPQE